MQSYDIPLHDIKPIMEIDEYSFYYLLSSIGVGVIVCALISYGMYLMYKNTQKINTRKVHKQLLESLNLQDTKNTAYAISTYGLTFKDDSPRHHEMYDNLMQRLQEFKYKKDVEAFDSETLGYIEIYKEMLDV